MKRYRPVEVSEAHLEDLVRQAPELIEAGLEFVDHQAFTDRGPLDVLMVDSGHSLVVAELKVIEDDMMLVQGIDYYDYVIRNLDGYSRAYNKHRIDPAQEPRLFLIAPSFSVTLLNRVKWIEIPVSLFTYQCIEFSDGKGDIVPVYKEVTAPGLPGRVETYSLDDRFAYITDANMRSMAQGLVASIQSWDPQKVLVEAIKYAISSTLDTSSPMWCPAARALSSQRTTRKESGRVRTLTTRPTSNSFCRSREHVLKGCAGRQLRVS